MVCLGNICRSPTAQGVFEKAIENRGLGDVINVDSAGTGDWHLGQPPDPRSVAAAAARGYDLSTQRARQVTDDDFERFDWILAMDSNNLRDLMKRCPTTAEHKLQLFLSFAGSEHESVPDPYYSGDKGFELVLDLVEVASDNLLSHLIDTYGLSAH